LVIFRSCEQQEKDAVMRKWFDRCGDRELFWVMIALIGLIVFGMNALAGPA
jgi:hypothetical protein